MAETEFYMIGLIHGDKEGGNILKRLLSSIRPDVITLEFTNFGLSFRKRNYRMLRKRLVNLLKRNFRGFDREMVERIIGFLRPPFEYAVSKRYAEENGIPLYLVDMDFFSFMKLRYVSELFDPENLTNLISRGGSSSVEEKRAAIMYFEKNIKLFAYTPEMRVRDQFARRLIGKIMERHRARKLVHICGWQHLADQYGFFSDLNPKKIFIYDKALRF